MKGEEPYQAKIFRNGAVLYVGDSEGASDSQIVIGECDVDAATNNFYNDNNSYDGTKRYGNLSSLVKGEDNIQCLGIDPDLCGGTRLHTMIGRHSFFNCESEACRRNNFLGLRDVHPFVNSRGVPDQDLTIRDDIVMSHIDRTTVYKVGSIPTIYNLNLFNERMFNAFRGYKRMRVVNLNGPGSLPTAGEPIAYILYQNHDVCTVVPEPDTRGASVCEGDVWTVHKTVRNMTSNMTINGNVVCQGPVTFFVFTEKRTGPKATFRILVPERTESNYTGTRTVEWIGHGCSTRYDSETEEVIAQHIMEGIDGLCDGEEDTECGIVPTENMIEDFALFRHDVCGCRERPNDCGRVISFREYTYNYERLEPSDFLGCEMDNVKSYNRYLIDMLECENTIPMYRW